MGINIPIVLYTHTDMKDIWPMVFGQTKKYLSNYKIYVAVNKSDDTIPEDYTTIVYDDTKPYTKRWDDILPNITEDVILFLHEDMILLGEPNTHLINEYADLVRAKIINSVKLIFVGSSATPSYLHPTLVSNELSKLSIQPTVIAKETLHNIFNEVGPTNIWDFEMVVSQRLGDFMAYLGTERKRGMYHYDSKVFPYIATAINKGKWNYSEYKNELDVLFSEYNMSYHKRGTV